MSIEEVVGRWRLLSAARCCIKLLYKYEKEKLKDVTGLARFFGLSEMEIREMIDDAERGTQIRQR